VWFQKAWPPRHSHSGPAVGLAALARVEAEIANLTHAVAAGGGDGRALVAALRGREAERERLRRDLGAAEEAGVEPEAPPAAIAAQVAEALMCDGRFPCVSAVS